MSYATPADMLARYGEATMVGLSDLTRRGEMEEATVQLAPLPRLTAISTATAVPLRLSHASSPSIAATSPATVLLPDCVS